MLDVPSIEGLELGSEARMQPLDACPSVMGRSTQQSQKTRLANGSWTFMACAGFIDGSADRGIVPLTRARRTFPKSKTVVSEASVASAMASTLTSVVAHQCAGPLPRACGTSPKCNDIASKSPVLQPLWHLHATQSTAAEVPAAFTADTAHHCWHLERDFGMRVQGLGKRARRELARALTFDMRGGRKWAKPACGRPLDGRVRRTSSAPNLRGP